MTEWSLDTDHVNSAAGIVVQILVFVSAHGKLEGYELLSSNVDEAQTQQLLAPIYQTRFTPALRNGQSVPSTRRIELIVDNNASPSL